MIQFFVRCVPPKATAQGKRLAMTPSGPRFFKGQRLKEDEESLTALFAPHAPEKPLEGPVSVVISAFWPPTKTETKTKAGKARFEGEGSVWHTGKPDADNFAKQVLDVMTRLRFWHDDSQVCALHVLKGRKSDAGIEINVTGLGQ